MIALDFYLSIYPDFFKTHFKINSLAIAQTTYYGCSAKPKAPQWSIHFSGTGHTSELWQKVKMSMELTINT